MNQPVLAMLEEVIAAQNKQNQKLDTLLQRPEVQQSIEDLTEGTELTPYVFTPPPVQEVCYVHSHRFEFPSWRLAATVVGLVLLTVGSLVLSYELYQAAQQNEHNALKYRYLKMKGRVTAQGIADLEHLFEVERNHSTIEQMRLDVAAYECAVSAKAALDEQTRLRQIESEKLNNKAKSLKNSYLR